MSESIDVTPIHAPGQLALTLAPGRTMPGQPRRVWKSWSPEEQLEIEMSDVPGGYSIGRYVEVAA